MQRYFSIRTRLILCLSLILIAAFLIITMTHYNSSRKLLRDNLIENTLPLTSDNIYSEIQKDLMSPIFVSSLMANDTFLKDWLLDGEGGVEKITKYLTEIKSKYGFFSTFVVSSQTGRYYHFDGVLKTLSREDDHDVWYYRFLEQHQEYALDVDTDQASDNSLTIFINHRLEDYEGHLIGVTGAGLNVDHINKMVHMYQKKYNRNIYFVSPDGTVQLHTETERIERDNIIKGSRLKEVAPHLLVRGKPSASYEVACDRSTLLITSRYIPEFDWFLIVEMDETMMLNHLRRNSLINFGVGLLVTLLVIGVNIVTVNYFQDRLERMATTDKLTQVKNRRAFEHDFHRFAYTMSRDGTLFSLVMFDIDHFKAVNDSSGHLFGDEVIRAVAGVSEASIRRLDVLARWGGDEFVILFRGGEAEGQIFSERLRKNIEETDFYADSSVPVEKRLPVTVTCGGAESTPGEGLDALISRADRVLYRAKSAGRNCSLWDTEGDEA
ncbi:sensor domain-containing diguanylate cyclase [Desulfoluna sp.]|uniref:sensor domain-containing diguanylate cyclase n=1 Tax=Desulfoluna sp. TaxID=2045199 RepID=UPI002623895A|nr:sensor domain-containing diguanylate cyclase [Desulfoluna sp.]